ncbi:MAG: polysaccharide pyruvyl transferase family protein [Gammaproteobacteria bacterium]|jgi:hypothetical protein|nr:polysaccharide pyruvyl transferase family protein [Gammaproteobacteria bacterium]MCU0971096.1 polysaccharide pyruvyl transferase family protein [Gammaproteobacteria bacterium]
MQDDAITMPSTLDAVLVNDTSVSGHAGCVLVVDQIRRLAAEQGIRFTAACPLRSHWHSLEADLLRADLCIVNGEGTIHHSGKTGLALVEAATWCRRHQIPCALINAVYQENDERFHRHTRSFDRVYVRESLSRQSLAEQGIDAQVVPDLTLSASVGPKAGRSRSGVLYNDSVRRATAEALFELSRRGPLPGQFVLIEGRGPRRTARQGVAALLRHAGKVLRHRVRRGVYGRLARLPRLGRSDRIVLEAVLSAPAPGLDELLERIAASECFVTGRFHGICLALLTRTPFLTLASNSHKTEGMLADLGMSHRLLPDTDGLASRLSGGFAFDAAEQARVDAYLTRARQSAVAMFADIAALARDRRR